MGKAYQVGARFQVSGFGENNSTETRNLKPVTRYVKLSNVATRSSPTTTRRPWQVVRLFLSLLVIAATVFLGARVLARYFAVSEVPLPNLVGLSSEDAQKTLQDLGLTAKIYPSIVADAPINTVTSQSPRAGFVVREGRSISLEINTPTTVAVPSLVGSTEEQARNILQRLALELGTITYDFSNDVPEGQILSQNPPPNTNVPVQSTVSIAVSRGSDVPKVSMPDVRGQNIDAAKSRLRSLGFTNIDTVPSSVTNDAGQTVTQQSPAPSQSVTASTRVTLGYSLSSQIVRQVPNLMGMSLANAQVILQNAGLMIGPVSFINDPAQVGGIVEYKPKNYTLAGAPVQLTFNGYEAIPQALPSQTPGQTPPTQPNPNQPIQTQPTTVPQGPPPGAEVPGGTTTTPATPTASADGSREVPFTFDPGQWGISQLMNQEYRLRVSVTDEQGEVRELLNRSVPPGQPVTASLKVYGEATIQIYINELLFSAYNP
jgi:beta-lactam-binding protein with PASTA domain